MTRLPESLKADNFSAVRTCISKHYGERFDGAEIREMNGGGFSYGLLVIDPTTSDPFFLKLSKPGSSGKEGFDPHSATYYMQFLAEHGVPTPKTLSTQDGTLVGDVTAHTDLEGYNVIMMEACVGRSTPYPVKDRDPHYFKYSEGVARTIGQMHAAQTEASFDTTAHPVQTNPLSFQATKEEILKGFGFTGEEDLETLRSELTDPTSETSKYVATTMERLRAHAGNTTRSENRDILMTYADQIKSGLIAQSIDRLIVLQEASRTFGSLPVGICHGDANPSNFLVDDTGKITVIDYDEMFVGPLLWDLTEAVLYGFEITPKEGKVECHPDVVEATLASYGTQRKLSDEELTALPHMVGARGMAYFGRRLANSPLPVCMTSDTVDPKTLNEPMVPPHMMTMPLGYVEQSEMVRSACEAHQKSTHRLSSDVALDISAAT
ncbi:MAG: phosphotransferase, partial [Candidatus Pacebacteria bacterium]|nr:phosphotransferase [Candidatus Paceibacterota bacterium]